MEVQARRAGGRGQTRFGNPTRPPRGLTLLLAPRPSTLEATQGQNDSFFSQLPYKCHQNRVASVGDWLEICPWVASRVERGCLSQTGEDEGGAEIENGQGGEDPLLQVERDKHRMAMLAAGLEGWRLKWEVVQRRCDGAHAAAHVRGQRPPRDDAGNAASCLMCGVDAEVVCFSGG